MYDTAGRSVARAQLIGRIASPDTGSHVTKANPVKAGDAKLRDYSEFIATSVEPPSEPPKTGTNLMSVAILSVVGILPHGLLAVAKPILQSVVKLATKAVAARLHRRRDREQLEGQLESVRLQESGKTERKRMEEDGKTERARLKYAATIMTTAMKQGIPLRPELLGEVPRETASSFPLGALASSVVTGGGSGTDVSSDLLRGGQTWPGVQQVADELAPEVRRGEGPHPDGRSPLSDGGVNGLIVHRPQDNPPVLGDR